jgi:flagellar assembly protein FliH
MDNGRIPAQDSQQYPNWRLPEVSAGHRVAAGKDPKDEIVARHLTARDLEAITQQAHEEGFAHGREEGHQAGFADGLAAGRAAAKAELTNQIMHLQNVMTTLLEPMREQGAAIEQALSQLAVDIAHAVLRREPALAARDLLPIVRSAVRELPVGARNITVLLNPGELELMRDCAEWPPAWQMQADSRIDAGGCRVHSDSSVVDYTIGLRFRQVAERILAAHAQSDTPEPGLLMERFDE